jgi:DNA primase
VKEAVQCATRLKRSRLLQLNTELQYALREAESTGDVAATQQLMRKLLANQQQLRTIDAASRLQG